MVQSLIKEKKIVHTNMQFRRVLDIVFWVVQGIWVLFY